MQDHQVVAEHFIDLGIDRGRGPEHRLSVVAADRIVVHHHAGRRFEDCTVADRFCGTRQHLETQRTDVVMDDDLSHGGRTFDVERTVVPIIDGHFDTAVVTADEQDPGRAATVQASPVR